VTGTSGSATRPWPCPTPIAPVPASVQAGPPANIAALALYQEVAQAIAEARQPHPSFETALRHHRLLAAIEQSAADGGITLV
jgi:predicted dehydrogenase